MFNRILNHLEEWLIAFLIGAATVVIFISVLHRSLAGVPVVQDWVIQFNVSWAQELCIYMFVWMAKFGAAYGVRNGVHVGVDVLVRKLSPEKARWLITIGLFGGALFTAVVGALGAHFVNEMSQTGQVSADLEWPMWIIYMCVPVGSFLMCYRFLQVIWAYVRTGQLPHSDHAHVDGVDEDEAAKAIAAGAHK